MGNSKHKVTGVDRGQKAIGLVHTWDQTAAYRQKNKKIKRYNKPVLLERRKQISSLQVLPAIKWPHQHRMGNSCHHDFQIF